MPPRPGRRVAIVAGLRTAFVKANTSFKDLSALELGKQVVGELVQRAEIPAKAIDQIVFGTVIPSVELPNIAREVGLAAGLPKNVDAHSVVRACATSLQAMTSAADAIALGEIDLAVVGGSEAMSDVPITYSRPVAQAVLAPSRGRSLAEKLHAFQHVCAKERVRELGLRPLGFLRAYAYAAVDPGWQLLQAPAFSAPKALKRAGMKLSDIDLVEIHEAFAAQVLSNLQAWSSKKFADEHLGGAEPIGGVPDEQLNARDGSIALGHHFAATGARLVHQALRELDEKGKNTALISICAAGGLGAACVLERT